MKKVIIAIVLFSAMSGTARAEEILFSIACGENREQGFKKAEVAMAQDLESTVQLYLDGKKMSDDQVDMGNSDDGWIMTLHREGKDARKFEFSESKKSVQEYLVEENGKQKKVGKPLRCLFSDI